MIDCFSRDEKKIVEDDNGAENNVCKLCCYYLKEFKIVQSK